MRTRARWGWLLGLPAALVVVPALTLALLEGSSSLLLVLMDLLAFKEPLVAERLHTRYDPDLGWGNIPNLFIPDMYGPGVYLRTNTVGFRGQRDIPVRVPDDRVRVVCSGDSFTLGYGVDDDHAWCARLSARDARFETVNMGQGGYGIDQAYLWYKRDGAALDHHVQILAYITHDFGRMSSTRFLGYGKPILTLRDGRLEVGNVPVPPRAFYATWLRQWQAAIRGLRISEVIRRVREGRPRTAGAVPAAWAETPEDPVWKLARAVFADLVAINRAKGSTLVVVHLPTEDDHQGGSATEWRERARGTATDLGFLYVDLVEDFKRLAPGAAGALFIQGDVRDFVRSRGHYSVAGNEWVADRLFVRLVQLPAIADRLSRRPAQVPRPAGASSAHGEPRLPERTQRPGTVRER